MDLIRAMRKRASQLESQAEKIDNELGGLEKAIGYLTGNNNHTRKAHPWTQERRKKFQATMAAKRKSGNGNGKRIISAAARAKMSRAAKARWAKA